MKTLQEYLNNMNESRLSSRMRGYITANLPHADYSNYSSFNEIKKIADDIVKDLEDNDYKVMHTIGHNQYDCGVKKKDMSWFADGLKNLDSFPEPNNAGVITIQTEYKYKNRYNPTLQFRLINDTGTGYCWNAAEKRWIKAISRYPKDVFED